MEGVKDLLGQAEDYVFVVSDESESECGSTKDDNSCPSWTTRVDDEPDWIVRYTNAIPYVHSIAVHTDDGWYRGEDCASPSEVAPAGKHAILPAPDGSLALKADAVLPSAPPRRTKYGERLLERRVYHEKAKREDHEELDPVRKPRWKSEPKRTGFLWLVTAFEPRRWHIPYTFRVKLTPP